MPFPRSAPTPQTVAKFRAAFNLALARYRLELARLDAATGGNALTAGVLGAQLDQLSLKNLELTYKAERAAYVLAVRNARRRR